MTATLTPGPLPTSPADPVPATRSVAEVVVHACVTLGVTHAFMTTPARTNHRVRLALAEAGVHVLALTGRTAAVHAAIEASIVSGRLVLVVDASPADLVDAEAAGAKVLALTVRPPGGEAGPETSEPGLHSFSITSVVELGLALTRLQLQVSSQEAFLTHVEVDGRLLGQRTDVPVRQSASGMTARGADRDVVAAVARLIADERIALWVGRGSQSATTEIQALLRRTGWPAIATPAAKGVVPEDHPAYIGVSSSIGHRSVPGALRAYAPSRLLVLGLETDEHDPFDTALVPRGGIVHVQPQPAVSSLPWNAPVLAVPADVGAFVEGLLRALPARGTETTLDARRPFPADPPPLPTPPCWVRPAVLMSRLQRMVLDSDDARILVDGRRATVLAARHLRLLAPGRLRLLGRRAPAGQLVNGAIGVATAGGRVVCVTDDPFLLLSSQATVAAAKRLPVSWVVLNQGCSPDRRVEPVGLARAMGVEAVHVEREAFLDAALSRALTVDGPFVVEVVVNRRAGTSLSRNGHRVMQGWA